MHVASKMNTDVPRLISLTSWQRNVNVPRDLWHLLQSLKMLNVAWAGVT